MWEMGYFFDMFFNLILIVLEDSHILDFVFLCVLKKVTVLFHESGLDLLELRVYNDLLEGGNDLIEKYLLGGGRI